MKWQYNSNYPSIDGLIKKTNRKIPKFAFEYLDGGSNEDVNQVELQPYYLTKHFGTSSPINRLTSTFTW